MALNATQIAEHAYKAGFRGDALSTAVAVALAESTGDPNQHNAVPPDDSYGLWQINMLGSLGPARRQQFGLHSDNQLLNPDTNARAAWAISNHGTNWQPWTTYNTGAYKNYLDAAKKAAHDVTAHHGSTGQHAKHPSGHHAAHSSGQHGSGKQYSSGAHDGFKVDTAVLDDYASLTTQIADELGTLNQKQKPTLLGVKSDIFGGIGTDTQLAKSIAEFGKRAERNINWLTNSSKEMAGRVREHSTHYKTTEHHNTDTFKGSGGKTVTESFGGTKGTK
ncbi:MAG: transglycosylase SLT domain-containing protein [Sciscionella sp.]|nr:transglycosylase SLT domain-containing protein [Sciscionella sp.]